jgi:hypothetical protein
MLCQLRLPLFDVGFLERHNLAAFRLTVVGNEVYGCFWTLFPLPESVTVDNPENYLCQPAFSSAVLESDSARMLGKICEAFAAVEQRLLSSIEEGERRAIIAVQQALEALKATHRR